mgnify:CR=1 FL=1
MYHVILAHLVLSKLQEDHWRVLDAILQQTHERQHEEDGRDADQRVALVALAVGDHEASSTDEASDQQQELIVEMRYRLPHVRVWCEVDRWASEGDRLKREAVCWAAEQQANDALDLSIEPDISLIGDGGL